MDTDKQTEAEHKETTLVTREDGDLGMLLPNHCQALAGIVEKENVNMELKDNK